jgi:RNA polymerase sigma-70 factor (ECF subfamily)
LKPFEAASDEETFDERHWLSLAKAGDRAAFGRLVEHHRERLYYAALGLVRNHEDARDLSQEAFVKVFKSLDRFDLRRPFYPWLYRILRNLCLDYLERHGPQRRISFDALVEDHNIQFREEQRHGRRDTGDARDAIQRQQMAAHLRTAIDELKPEFREIILMKHFQDMAYKEIAEALDIPEGTVMSRLFHARKALARLMEKHQ